MKHRFEALKRRAERLSHNPLAVHLPTPMMRDVQQKAALLGVSPSWCLRMAWCLAGQRMHDPSALEGVARHRLLKGRRRTLPLELPVETLVDLTAGAEVLDRSRSWLLQRAWVLARPKLLGALRR